MMKLSKMVSQKILNLCLLIGLIGLFASFNLRFYQSKEKSSFNINLANELDFRYIQVPAEEAFQTPEILPFKRREQLDGCIPINRSSYDGSKPIVIIYTYLACKPCLKLAKKVNDILDSINISSAQIVYVNPVDYDTIRIKNYLHKNNYQSPYYVTKWPQFDGAFPKISGYNVGGNLEWVEYGYSTRVVKKIENHLRKK